MPRSEMSRPSGVHRGLRVVDPVDVAQHGLTPQIAEPFEE